MSSLLTLELQPDFPHSDLLPQNAAVIPHLLENEASIRLRTEQLTTTQRRLLETTCNALLALGVDCTESPQTLEAFSWGFATFETVALLVRPPEVYDVAAAARQFAPFAEASRLDLVESKTIPLGSVETNAAFLLSETIARFPREAPGTARVLARLGRRCRTTIELEAFTSGGAIARHLQLAA